MSSPFDAIGGAIDRARGAVGGFIDRRTDGTPLEGAGDSFADVLRPQPPAQERRDGQASNRAGDAGGGNVVQRAANAFERATNDIPVLEGLGDWAGETLGGESQTPGRVRTELADAASALASGGSPGLAEKSTAAPEGDGESWRLGGLDDFVDGWRNGAARAHRFGVVIDYLSGQHPEMIPPIEPREFDEHTVTGRIGQTIAGVGADLATLPFIPGHERIKASREDSTIAPNTAYWLGMADMAGTVLPPVWSAGTAALTESGRALADRETDVGLADAALRGLQAGALSLAFDRVTDGLSDGLSGLGGGSGNGGLFGDLLPEPVGVRILDNPVDGPQGLRGPTTPPDEPLGQNVFASWWGGKKIEEGKQGKHQPDHNNFIPGRSELTHPDPQELLDKHAGTGQRAGRETVGEPGSKERVDFGEPIGKHVDQHTGEKNETTVGMIHYSKKGAHIVPARPSSSD